MFTLCKNSAAVNGGDYSLVPVLFLSFMFIVFVVFEGRLSP